MRNYAASENPPRRWRRRPEKSRHVAPGWPIYLTDGTDYVPLNQLPQRLRDVLYEAIGRFDRLHVGA